MIRHLRLMKVLATLGVAAPVTFLFAHFASHQGLPALLAQRGLVMVPAFALAAVLITITREIADRVENH